MLEVPKLYGACGAKAGRRLQIFCVFSPFPDVFNTLDQLTTQVEEDRRQRTFLVASDKYDVLPVSALVGGLWE